MDKKEIVSSILSGNQDKITEAKKALKDMLSVSSVSFKDEVRKFVTKKLFESAYDCQNGPFPAGTVVHDVQRGVVGTVHIDPHNSEHPVQVHVADGQKFQYGPDEIKNLVKHQGEMADIIDMISGKTKGV